MESAGPDRTVPRTDTVTAMKRPIPPNSDSHSHFYGSVNVLVSHLRPLFDWVPNVQGLLHQTAIKRALIEALNDILHLWAPAQNIFI
jgi:hypothetical protein